MSMKEQLSQLIDDPEKLDAILKLTEGKLSPQQRYMRSEKGKEAKKRSNQKYAAKPKQVILDIAERYLQHWKNGKANLALLHHSGTWTAGQRNLEG